MSVDWSKPIQFSGFSQFTDSNLHVVGVDKNNPQFPIVVSWMSGADGGFTHHYSEHGVAEGKAKGYYADQRDIINVPEPEPWMVKAAEELVQCYHPLILTKQRAIEILMKHARGAV